MSIIDTILDAVEAVTDHSKKRRKQETAPNSHSDSKLSYAYECYKAEHERRRRIETKSASLVTTIGVVATLITAGVIRLFLKNYEYGTLEYTLMIALFLMSLFLGLSCYYAVMALRPQQYSYIEISDFKNYNDESYYEEFIKKLNDCIEYNIPLGQKKCKRPNLGPGLIWLR